VKKPHPEQRSVVFDGTVPLVVDLFLDQVVNVHQKANRASRHFANSIRVDLAAFLNQPLKCGIGIDLGVKGADRDPPTTVGMPSLKRKAPALVRAHGVLTPHPCPEEFLAASTHDEECIC
jgi:hypothetical protein